MFNCFTNCPLVKGIAIGVGASALGFCLYKANEGKRSMLSCAVMVSTSRPLPRALRPCLSRI